MSYDISFIVPAYNVEKYIGQCLESILKQDVSKEVLIINDGSTDDTVSICKKYEKMYDCIKLFTKENGGLSSARNYGMKQAKGKYIWFVDSDDFIPHSVASDLLQIAETNDLDIIKGLYSIFDEKINAYDYRNIDRNYKYVNQLLNGHKLIELQMQDNCYEVVAWLGLFKRKYLERISVSFYEGVTYEDHEFNLRVMLSDINCRSMMINKEIYVYRQRDNSITKIFSLKDIEGIEININRMLDFISSNDLDESQVNTAYKAIGLLFYQLTRVYGGLSQNLKNELELNISQKRSRLLIRHSMNIHQKIKIILFIYFRPLVDWIYDIKKGG